ncbi:MAG: hypothetical protein H7A46_08855 [Verrucomicrobiales bacterium]|nr:hypothetical protein [Verrucomicrobiales bacterium]
MKKSIFSEVSSLEARKLVDELRPDDGVDPREEAKRRRKERREAGSGQAHGVHKHEQFLAQARLAIDTALRTAATPVLNRLTVREVVQEGGSLVVVVTPMEGDAQVDLVEATRAVQHAIPMLRRELAAEITRKETPNLKVVVLPREARKTDG